MRKLALLTMVLAQGAASAQVSDSPIWQRHPTLVCRADFAQFCERDGTCSSRPSTAVYLVNFPAGTIRATASPQPSKIINRHHYVGDAAFPGSDHITTDDRGTFLFEREHKEFAYTPTIDAVVADANLFGPSIIWMKCNPG